MTARRVTIYVGEPLMAALAATVNEGEDGGSRSGRINTVAERYMEIVRRSMPDLSQPEWMAVIDALNGTLLDARGVRYIADEIADSPDLATKWGVDTIGLEAKLRTMPYAALTAVAEVSERYWASTASSDQAKLAQAGVSVVAVAAQR